ncbi:MAG: hypothetical protein ACRBCL_12465 [Maritimibacter sp.]
MILRRLSAVIFALALGASPAQAQDRTFFAEGSDTVLGLGARHLAMGGTGTATANDPYAVYWNPARLSAVEGTQISINRQLNAKLRPYTFIGAAVPVDWLENAGLDMMFGAARYPRVHARSTGAFSETDPQSIFLRLLLPGVMGTYDGDIDSKTMVNRFAVALAPHDSDRFSLAFHLDWIDCKSNTCGVHAGSNGYEWRSVHARAWSKGVSGTFKLSDNLTLGASYGDINTVLDVDMNVTDDLGSFDTVWQAKLPSYQRVELMWEPGDRTVLAFGYQKFAGVYGSTSLKFETLHFGAERKFGQYFTGRLGAWMPITIEAQDLPVVTLPVPFVPSAGIGFEYGSLKADLGVYVHPIMSFHKNGPAPTAELSLTYTF